jgi:two-component system sensor histidine kinase HydH
MLLVAVLALPLVLLVSSLGTFRQLDEQRTVYLRARAGVVADRLESAALRSFEAADLYRVLAEEEPALIEIQIISRGDPAAQAPYLDLLWSARQLYLTRFVESAGRSLFRTWVPFHRGGQLHIVRIDLDAAAADFLLAHARRNIAWSVTGGFVLVLLSLYAVWSASRNARLERRQLALEHLAQIGRMGAVLAHEIRNPLGTIKGFAQLAQEKNYADLDPLLAPILDESARLENLVNDLLLYARPPAPALRDVAWKEIEEEVAADAVRVIGARAIGFTADGPLFTLHTDPNLLKQILRNLVRNAIDAVSGAPGAGIRLAVSLSRRGAAVSVTDNGPGIPAEIRARLFEPFFTTKASGTGLGLSICRTLATALGGRIDVRRVPSGGTAAVVELPLAE